MEMLLQILIPLLALPLLLRLMLAPIKWVWKIFLNTLCGFLCLWLVNGMAPITGLTIPINLVTVTVTGVLGLPGLCVLALVQLFL